MAKRTSKKSASSSKPNKRNRTRANMMKKPTRKRAVPRGTSHPRPTDGHIEIIARGVMVRGSRVLLCQNLKHGYYYLPGGHVEFGESAAAAVEREFLEETGKHVRAGELLMVDEGVFDSSKSRHHEINLVFHVEQSGGKSDSSRPIVSQESHLGFEWLELAAIPEADIRPLSAKAFLAAGPLASRSGATAAVGAEWVSAFPAR